MMAGIPLYGTGKFVQEFSDWLTLPVPWDGEIDEGLRHKSR